MSRLFERRAATRCWLAVVVGCLGWLCASQAAEAVPPLRGEGGVVELVRKAGSGAKAKGKGKGKEKGKETFPGGGLLPGPGAGKESGTAAEDLGSDGAVDPLSGLGIRNPVCDRISEIQDRATRLSCEASGTPQSNYPPGNYGFDIHIKTGMTHPVGTMSYGFATILSQVWLGLTFVLHQVFALLGLAFGLNPFGDGRTMSEVTVALGRMYNRITDPWLTTLVVCGGIWFAYKGLVKREISASAAGTVAAIALLVVGMWVVHQPRQSVGWLAKLSDRVALGVISAPQSGSVNRPVGSYAEAMTSTWNRLVEVPFAGLDFSDVRWALSKPPPEAVEKADEKFCDDDGMLATLATLAELGSEDAKAACAAYAKQRYGKPRRVIDLYLRSSRGSPSRDALWDYFDNDDKYKAKVAAQGGDGVFSRLSMLALFAIGLLGAMMLLAWLALRLFMQAAIAFVLLLVAPFALFFPMLGETGRRAFRTWGLALLGAIVSKVVYAMFLSVVLMGITVLGKVNGPAGSSTGFLLSCVFAWAVFLKRSEVIGWMRLGEGESGGSHGFGMGHYHAMQWGERIGGMPVGALRGLGRRTARWRRARRGDAAEATTGSAQGALRKSARALADNRLGDAKDVVASYEAAHGKGGKGRKGKAGAGPSSADGKRAEKGGEASSRGGSRGAAPDADAGARPLVGTSRTSGKRGSPAAKQKAQQATQQVPSEERYRAAKELIGRAQRNERQGGERWSDKDLKRFEGEDRELLRGKGGAAEHAHRIGMSRAKFESLQGPERHEAEAEIKRARKRDAQRSRLVSETPGRIVGGSRRAAERMRQQRAVLAGAGDRYQHLRRVRGERRAAERQRLRRNVSRGG